MKNLIAIFMMLVLITASGCWSTKESDQGGISSGNQEFSIIVPSSTTVKQGDETTVTVSLKRGAYFKQDVKLDIEANGIGVKPNYVLIKASDVPDAKIRVIVGASAALGEYRVSVKGTPTTGNATSAVLIVKVVAQ
ncbi:MAG: hypothetical protein A2020_10180 [Lentisphaerae bacterium GWF2_45_14]|nr:MAG: hypothetical protein A2020_10180 [Lentisphaerae bacterium GWF2_45_14]